MTEHKRQCQITAWPWRRRVSAVWTWTGFFVGGAAFPTRHGIYGGYAARVRAIAEGFTPVSQVASIDEMFLDFSGCEALYRTASDAHDDATIERVEHDPAGTAHGTISNERTFREDVRDPDRIEATLSALCERVCWRARKRGVKAMTVALKLRSADFETLSRSRTITATCSELELYPVIVDLLAQARTRRLPIRLLGVCLSNLRPYDEQLYLFDASEPLHRTVDEIRRRFGFEALRMAHAAPVREE